MRHGTGEVESRGGERCAPATVGAGKGGEEVRANDGWAPRLVVRIKGVHRRGAHQGNRVLVHPCNE